ncbi:pyridoxal phosphate homeostasis protein-like [Lytechinus pictus]|uniref:pyridoxal phosphate homeostasis protein-like n=1 Tax=Lytechinus pictus TaxID=7653 RepID=UPI0030B9B3DE
MQRIIMTAENSVAKALRSVGERIQAASMQRTSTIPSVEPRLVAVSKTKPVSMILEAYQTGQRNFGENYVQELVDKSHDATIREQCTDIRWHYIGHLQSNKVKKLLSSPNLYMVETVDSRKLASELEKHWSKETDRGTLRVFVQVNTSGEANKSGVSPEDCSGVVRHLFDNCSSLEFAGLMTIGSFDHSLDNGPNPDFQCLIRCREEVCKECSLDIDKVELSMGMSHDFEHAISVGSTNVRVGSTIFGAREKAKSKSEPPVKNKDEPA